MQPQPPTQYPESSQAVTALVLGILGVITCPFLGPVAWVLGRRELAGIDTGRRPPDGRSMASAGRVLGIIGSFFIFLLIAAIVAVAVAVPMLDPEILDEVAGSLSGSPEVGDCGDWPGETGPLGVPADCDEPHDFEVFAIFDLAYDLDSPYPGEDPVADEAESTCLDEFEAYVGKSYAESLLEVTFVYPSEETWDTGDREVFCMLHAANGKLDTGQRGAAV